MGKLCLNVLLLSDFGRVVSAYMLDYFSVEGRGSLLKWQHFKKNSKTLLQYNHSLLCLRAESCSNFCADVIFSSVLVYMSLFHISLSFNVGAEFNAPETFSF